MNDVVCDLQIRHGNICRDMVNDRDRYFGRCKLANALIDLHEFDCGKMGILKNETGIGRNSRFSFWLVGLFLQRFLDGRQRDDRFVTVRLWGGEI